MVYYSAHLYNGFHANANINKCMEITVVSFNTVDWYIEDSMLNCYEMQMCGREWEREWEQKCHCILEMMVELRVVRKRMGVLFCTTPWYSSSEMSFRVTESRWACILILGTSRRDGSVKAGERQIDRSSGKLVNKKLKTIQNKQKSYIFKILPSKDFEVTVLHSITSASLLGMMSFSTFTAILTDGLVRRKISQKMQKTVSDHN
jgi:hypothetical protein